MQNNYGSKAIEKAITIYLFIIILLFGVHTMIPNRQDGTVLNPGIYLVKRLPFVVIIKRNTHAILKEKSFRYKVERSQTVRVPEGYVGVLIYRDGVISNKPLLPGIYHIDPDTQKIEIIDTRPQTRYYGKIPEKKFPFYKRNRKLWI